MCKFLFKFGNFFSQMLVTKDFVRSNTVHNILANSLLNIINITQNKIFVLNVLILKLILIYIYSFVAKFYLFLKLIFISQFFIFHIIYIYISLKLKQSFQLLILLSSLKGRTTSSQIGSLCTIPHSKQKSSYFWMPSILLIIFIQSSFC